VSYHVVPAPIDAERGRQVIAKKTEPRTDRVPMDMSEVTGMQSVNETLAHHAAWTDERFEGVEERLGGLDLGQQHVREELAGLSTKMDGMSIRVGNLEFAFVGMRADMVRMETRIRSDVGKARAEIRGDIDILAVRLDRVLAHAARDEFRLASAQSEPLDDESNRA
jgi:hypothetical protein